MKKRFKGQKVIILTIDQNVRDEAKNYGDCHNCWIATAFKQQYNIKNVSVGSHTVRVMDEEGNALSRYRIDADGGRLTFLRAAVGTGMDFNIVLYKSSD